MTGKRQPLKQYRFSGVNSDIAPNMLPDDKYSDVVNMEPFDIGMVASQGITRAFGTPLFAPEYLVFNKDGANFYWLYASSAGLGVTDGQSHFDITPVTGISSTWPANWTDANLNGIVTINNGIDDPFYWNNTTANPAVTLPDWPAATKCGAIRAFNYSLIAMDITDSNGEFSNHLLWSNSADPGAIPDSWTPLPENDAGFNTLSDTLGAILDGVQYRNSFLLLKEHSTYQMDYIGGNFVYAFRKVFTTSGVLTSNCAAEYLGQVAILTDGDFILTDGQRAESLIDKRMRRWLFNNLDTDNYRQSFVVPYHARNQVWCCFPENGENECTLALVWDASDNKFGVRELKPTPHIARGQVGSITGVINWDDDPEAWDDDFTTWDQGLFNPTEDALLQADRVNTYLLAVNEGNTLDGALIKARVERLGLTFGTDEYVKLIKSVIPRVIGNTGTVLTIRIGTANNDSDPIQWSAPATHIIGTQQKTDIAASGRFISVSIESESDQPPWILHGIEFEYDVQGRY